MTIYITGYVKNYYTDKDEATYEDYVVDVTSIQNEYISLTLDLVVLQNHFSKVEIAPYSTQYTWTLGNT